MNMSFSGTLLRFVNFQKNIAIEAPTANDALSKLVSLYPQARQVIYDAEGKVRQVHQIFLNGKQLRADDLNNPVRSDDQLDILTAIAGG
ncbi:MAG: MoaD/ThiS family protein [Cellvibrio sp.]|uniref:MoaD/ThiS family protein n=1 Tax=Cellvibrio sp. TaxID=1965322 RepID=UPI0027243109|nr:MoaD/ThiS family protein [Cellvibrio sp.]